VNTWDWILRSRWPFRSQRLRSVSHGRPNPDGAPSLGSEPPGYGAAAAGTGCTCAKPHLAPQGVNMSRRIRWLIASAIIAFSVAITACAGSSGTSHSDSAPPPTMPAICTKSGPVVFAVSGRQDSPAPVLTGTMQAAVVSAIDSGSAIGLVNIDGTPQLIAASAFSDPTAGNQNAFTSDQTYYAQQVESGVVGVRATAPHANILGTLDVASRAIRAACRYGGTIYLEDSGLSETGSMDFRQQGLLEALPSDVVAFLTAQHELPHLKGISVVFVGIGDTAPPQHPLSIAQRDNLIAIWSAIAKAGGATSVQIDPAPLSGPAPARVPPVSLVPIPAEPVWTPPANSGSSNSGSGVFPDSGPVGFEPNTVVFRQPAAAVAALRPLARYLAAHPSVRIELTGTTAHWGSLAGCITLARERANTVKAVLVQMGARPSQIKTRGLGWQFPGYINDQGPGGTLLPGPAEHNRSVIVTML
jgi:OmpA-OmpF porin, OOP family